MKLIPTLLALLALAGCIGAGETVPPPPVDGPQPQAVPIPEVDSQPLPPL